MNRMRLVAIKHFEFKGRTYAIGDIFELPIGDAYKVITRRQAKRATNPFTVHVGVGTPSYPATNVTPDVADALTASDEALSAAQSHVVEAFARTVDAEMMAQTTPTAEPEQPAEEEKPRRRRRRQSSYEADAVPHESSEREWNSE